jgi:hypothetical protein
MSMAAVSTARKIGLAARVAGRMASRRATQSRTLGAFLKAGRATVSHWGRVLGQLWLEVIGFVFLSLAAVGVVAFFRAYVQYDAGKASAAHVVAAALFTVLFAWFGIDSFLRIRRRP